MHQKCETKEQAAALSVWLLVISDVHTFDAERVSGEFERRSFECKKAELALS